MKEYLRELPAIHAVQNDNRFTALQEESDIPYSTLTKWIQDIIHHIREQMLNNNWEQESPTKADLKNVIFTMLKQKSETFRQHNLRYVINATGTILHTNLGRARLSQKAIDQVVLTAGNYSNLEYDLEQGRRGSRHQLTESALTEITGAEAAMVVNNNAAAVYLILRTLAYKQEAIVSRGELVEIGGSFRISSIMEESGAMLREVGTTNKTHLFDYEQAIGDETAILMKVHTSNFKTIGFTDSVDTGKLVKLAQKHRQLLVYEDLGSGALYNFEAGDEPVVSNVLKTGVDIISFSGDKLLGGPQAGIILGRKELVDKLKRHQLARVLRVDKMTLAALEATIKSYAEGDDNDIPVIRDMSLSISEIQQRAETFVEGVRRKSKAWQFNIQEDTSQVGGGSMPDVELATLVVSVCHTQFTPQQIFNRLRTGQPAVLARLKHDRVLLDFRTIATCDIPVLIDCFAGM
ncbi:L-seryl-tRNA(Sec) selenium transferase [Lentibacillus kapialis]|uniref:L-seryl-tRNA(Sec) selenium transferase n=1 Tax=Lentibacillus kapialis TaxID=340214 RepID=A0A917PRY1_9BACI|nr:L-seryl-tRNA(Sec) selenium transferase [Lentibacillus kapialis]GGJ88836.1 L-seryl-tRNA(Sec) selenium transferase [Lentibacillus kapialis]